MLGTLVELAFSLEAFSLEALAPRAGEAGPGPITFQNVPKSMAEFTRVRAQERCFPASNSPKMSLGRHLHPKAT